MRIVDASVWVGRLVAQDVHYEASRRWLEAYAAQGGRLISPVLLLAEVSGAIARRTGNAKLGERAVEQVLRVPGLGLVPTDSRLGRMAAQLAADLKLRGTDAVYVALALYLRAPLVTWDCQQLERAGARVVVYTPGADPVQDLRWGKSRLNEAAGLEYPTWRSTERTQRFTEGT
jgi:predicted nucleic acid-binding protein